jgi:hypothetical protein
VLLDHTATREARACHQPELARHQSREAMELQVLLHQALLLRGMIDVMPWS